MACVSVGVAVPVSGAVADAADVVAAAVVVVDGEVEPVFPAGEHAASAATAPPAPRNSPRDLRLTRVFRSNSSPRSWSGCGWSRSGWRGAREVLMMQGNRTGLCRWPVAAVPLLCVGAELLARPAPGKVRRRHPPAAVVVPS